MTTYEFITRNRVKPISKQGLTPSMNSTKPTTDDRLNFTMREMPSQLIASQQDSPKEGGIPRLDSPRHNNPGLADSVFKNDSAVNIMQTAELQKIRNDSNSENGLDVKPKHRKSGFESRAQK